MSLPRQVVLDTNIVLDLFLFQDPRTEALRQQLLAKQWRWVATPHMRNELERVLTYPHIVAKLAFYQLQAEDILDQFDQWATLHTEPVAKSPYVCKDADDQAFIDLACVLARRSVESSMEPDKKLGMTDSATFVSLLSKDKAVLSMRKRLQQLSVSVSTGALS